MPVLPPLVCLAPDRQPEAEAFAAQFGLLLQDSLPSDGYALVLRETQLSLEHPHAHGAVMAEFVEGAAAHRRQFGGGKGQPVAKAIGIKGSYLPQVIDATAGLGRDAFVLATLGCEVTLIERSPVAAALLADGLARAAVHSDTADIVERMQLVHADAADWLLTLDSAQRPDVVYLDPMFPDTGKSAAAKKDMQAFQHCIGDDLDSERLLAAALQVAKKRVVVKRPRLGERIPGPPPNAELQGKSTRFDFYVPLASRPPR